MFAEIIPAAVTIFNPVQLLNDIITGIFLGIKVVIVGVADIFTSGPQFAYDKCKDAGEGIFGYRRSRNSDGKLKSPQRKLKKQVRISACVCNQQRLFF